jgi:ATP-dependent helicase/nuclease subunit B
MPPGTLLLAIATAAAEQFAPVSLLALLKHPLVMKGEGPDGGQSRLQWLEGARILDLALRGPRPPAGLDGVTDYLSDWSGRDADMRKRAKTWWQDVVPLLRPL